MKLVPMRFDKFDWQHNPKSLKVSCEKTTVVLTVPYTDDVLQQFGEKPIRISGVGELFGDDCLTQYNTLYELFSSSAEGVLCIPGLKPMYAYLDKLNMSADNTPSVITYSFEFVCTQKSPKCEYHSQYIEPENGESLWDIAYRCSADIDKLLMLNPDVSNVFDLDGIKGIRIC